MAENKRQSSGAKGSQTSAGTSTAGGMAANMVPLEAALSGAIGARYGIPLHPRCIVHYAHQRRTDNAVL